MKGLFERIHAALAVARILLLTELGREQNVRVAIIADSGRLIVRQRGIWDAYESVWDFEPGAEPARFAPEPPEFGQERPARANDGSRPGKGHLANDLGA